MPKVTATSSSSSSKKAQVVPTGHGKNKNVTGTNVQLVDQIWQCKYDEAVTVKVTKTVTMRNTLINKDFLQVFFKVLSGYWLSSFLCMKEFHFLFERVPAANAQAGESRKDPKPTAKRYWSESEDEDGEYDCYGKKLDANANTIDASRQRSREALELRQLPLSSTERAVLRWQSLVKVIEYTDGRTSVKLGVRL